MIEISYAQLLELVPVRNRHDLPECGYAKDLVSCPDRGSEKGVFDAFDPGFPYLFSGFGTDTGDDSVIRPKIEPVTREQRGGDVRHGVFESPNFTGFSVFGCGGWTDGHEVLVQSGETAYPEH